MIETRVSLQDNLWQYFVEPEEFSILNTNSNKLIGLTYENAEGYDNPNAEYTPPDDSYSQPTGYTSGVPVGYGSDADGKEIVAVKQNRQN